MIRTPGRVVVRRFRDGAVETVGRLLCAAHILSAPVGRASNL
jgi:hypothetical protein